MEHVMTGKGIEREVTIERESRRGRYRLKFLRTVQKNGSEEESRASTVVPSYNVVTVSSETRAVYVRP